MEGQCLYICTKFVIRRELMNFIGNKKIVERLSKSLKANAVGHAYLFSGPESVGKFTLAKLFALSVIAGKELNLEVDNFDKDALLDLVVIEPEIVEKKGVTKKKDISIEQVREAKQKLSLYPYHGKYKVLIIDGAHRASISAQNALLKILEEPNPTTIIILVTHEIDRILPTILSRLQVLNFGLVCEGDMREGFSGEFSFAADAVELAIGRPGLAKFLNENVEEKAFRKNALEEFQKIKNGSINDKFKLADELSKDAEKTQEKLNIWLWEMRKMAQGVTINEQKLIYQNIEKIQNSMTTLKRTNANAKLVLEVLFMDL